MYFRLVILNGLLLCALNSWGLTVQSLNIKWFGRGGDIAGEREDEYRLPYLRDFLEIESRKVDVYVFQEITEPDLLVEIFKGYTCSTYEASILPHQFVVLCAKDEIYIDNQTDFSLQETSKRLRAAHSVSVRQNNITYRIVGVHLKAQKDGTQIRVNQIKNFINGPLSKDESVIIIGDFNTFSNEHTDNEFSDVHYFNQLFEPEGFSEIPSFENTFLGQRNMTFDRAWLKGVTHLESNLLGPCLGEGKKEDKFMKREFYQKFISDHCSLRIEFQ